MSIVENIVFTEIHTSISSGHLQNYEMKSETFFPVCKTSITLK